MTDDLPGNWLTERLRLEPIRPEHAHELWAIRNDETVARWYDGWKPTREEAAERTRTMAYSWSHFGVHKWMAYHRETGDLVGRGGLSPTPAHEDWGRVNQLLPQESWTREVRKGPRGEMVHANWVEISWALLPEVWGAGYASEIGRAGLTYAFEELGMHAVVACTAHDKHRSRAVMERIGMSHAGHLDDLDDGPELTVYTLRR